MGFENVKEIIILMRSVRYFWKCLKIIKSNDLHNFENDLQ